MISAMLQYAKRLTKALVRRQMPVEVMDLSRARPISERFGFERGTPIDRYYIEQFLGAHYGSITGDVMEVGGSEYTRKFGRTVQSTRVLHATADHREVSVVGDLANTLTLPEASVDCLICTQTLGFIYDVRGAVEGINYILRPGGVVIATMAGISQVSRYDMDRWGDYWRFTDASIRRLFGEAFGTRVDVVTYGNVAAATALLQGIAVEDLPDRNVLDVRDENYQLIIGVCAQRPLTSSNA